MRTATNKNPTLKRYHDGAIHGEHSKPHEGVGSSWRRGENHPRPASCLVIYMPRKNPLVQALETESNVTRTENGALTHASSLSGVLDFFALGGALRSRTEEDIIKIFSRAFTEDPLLAMKVLFYLRDIRGGQGEKRTSRVLLRYAAIRYPEIITKNLKNIVEFGRWDDMYALVDTPCESAMWTVMREQYAIDQASDRPSLMGKWLRAENTSSKASRKLGKATRIALGFRDERGYRKALVALRKKIDIVEARMCGKQWSAIRYDAVPSYASMRYAKAFRNHDAERYQAYLDQVKSGEAKINASTLYPYDLIRQVYQLRADSTNMDTIDLQWSSLPNYCPVPEQSMVVVDTSGSMLNNVNGGTVPPIYVAVSLGLYFAERNTGIFKDYFMTFSEKPKLQKIVGTTLWEKVHNLASAEWAMNTNLIAVFETILATAKKNKVTADDMIKKVYIISDMQFDKATHRQNDVTIFNHIKAMYKAAKYEMPKLVFWNVDARVDQSPVTMDTNGTYLVSGCSPSVFKSVMESRTVTPIEMMLEVLNAERYRSVII